jgi:hypothetical protein
MTQRERVCLHEAIRSKDAEIERLGAPRSWHRCGARVRAHLLQPADARLLIGDKVSRVSAPDRRARAALWGACQRVRASEP